MPIRLLGRSDETPTETDAGDGKSNFTEVPAMIVDVPGHYNFRKTTMNMASGAKAIVLLLDAKDKAKFAEAAEILYDMLSDIDLISEQVPIMVACNK